MSDAPSYFSLQQVVEEVDDEWLRDFLSEDALETDVGEGVDELSHGLLF